MAPVGGELNFAPKAVNDLFDVNEDQALQGNVLTNDSDEYQGTLNVNSIVAVSPQHGNVTISENGDFTYTPRTNFNGNDAFSYQVINELGMTDTGIVEITINAVNDAPIALDNTYNITADGSLVVTAPGLLANDSDIDLDLLTLDTTAVSSPTKGTLTLNGDGSFEYVGSANMQGSDTFEYRIIDALGAQAIASVTINALDQNSPPTTANDNYSVDEDTTLIVNASQGLLANDTDPNNDTFIIDDSYVISPTHGQLLLDTDGSFSYIPDANYYGVDEFQYQVIDAFGATATATVTLTINSTPDNPVAQNDEYQFQYNQTLSVSGDNGLLKNDVNIEPGDLTVDQTPVVDVQSGTLLLSSDGSFTYQPNSDALDVDSFTYLVSNEQGLTATAQVVLSKTGSNSPAKANDDQYTLPEDSPTATLNVLDNDTDANGDTITLTSISNTVGTAQIVNNNIEYTPEPNYFGEVTLTYTISDGIANDAPQTSRGTVSLTILPVNDTPVASADSASMVEDAAPILVDVLVNDTDIDGDNLTITNVMTEFGSASIVENKVQYSPNPNSNGVAIVSYTISDGNGASASANLQITISPTNDAPVANSDSITIAEDAQATLINVLSNDTDIDSDNLTISSAVSDFGSVSIVNNQIQYTPAANDNGTASVTYTISDGTQSATGTLTVTITPVNDAPVANPDAATILEDAATTNINVLTNDTDVDGNTLSISTASTTTGSVSVAGSNLAYTPEANFNGQAIINYTISDGTDTAAGALTVTVTPVNDAPIANPDTATILEDAAATNINVLTNDTDVENDVLSISEANTSSGSVSVSGNNLIYTPESDFNGQATVNYTLSDGTDTAAGVLTVTVTPVNDAPVANPDSATILEDAVTTNINVLANDTDPESDSLSISAATTTTGSVSVAGSNLAYTPEANFNGQAIINYTVSDGTDTAAGVLTVTVTPVNDAPIANPDAATILEDAAATNINVLTNDTDVENDTLSISEANTSSGSVSVSGNNLIYTPESDFNGQATVNYTLSDGTDTAAGVLTVTVTPVNDAPVANPDSATILEDAVTTNINVLANDTDPESDSLSISAATTTTGSVSVAGSNLAYTPEANFNGQAIINYTVSDGTDTATGVLSITVTAVNDTPIANTDTVTINEDNATTVNVIANDTDIENDTLTITTVSADIGSADIVGNQVQYTPQADNNGTATVTYTISDGNAASSGTLNITITSVNDAPIANADTATILEDAAATNINVLANDTDVENDTLSISAVSATSGSVTSSGTDVIYTPAANFNGQASVSYTLSDGTDTAAGQLTITVTPVNDAPVANADAVTILEDAAATNINVIVNDTDIENDTLSISGATTDTGSVTVSGSNVVYTPSEDFNGQAIINYTLSDGTDTAPGVVTITVTPVNDAPVANADSATILEDAAATSIDVLSNDTDVEGNTLSISAANASTGSVSSSGNNVIYTPAANFSGQATVNYTLSDGTDTAAGQLTITVTPVNDAPVANPDTATILEDAAATSINVLSNDTDIENDTLSISSVVADTGSVTVSGSNIVYTPEADFNGQAVVNYTLNDGTDTAGGVLTITVTPVNDAPVAVSDTATINEDAPETTIDVISNDTDADITDTLSVTAVTADIGSASVESNQVKYTPALNSEGVATLTYTLSDGTDDVQGNLTITITPINDAPEAPNQTFSIGENATGGEVVGTITASDIESNTLNFSLSGGETALFNINSTSGEPSANGTSPFNYETATQHTVNINITDDGTPNETTTITATVNIIDEEDPLIPVEDDTFGRPLSGQIDLSHVFSDGEFNDSIELNTNLYFVGYNNNSDADIIVASYTNTGDVNTAFNGTGFKTIDLGEDEKGTAIISGNGELFIGYSSFDGTVTEACLLKMSTTGIVSTNSGDGNSGTKCTTLASESVINDLEFTDNKIQGVGYSVNGLDKDSLFLKYDVSTLAFEAGSPGIVDVSGNNDDDESHAIKNFGNSELLVVGSTIGVENDLDATVRYLIPDGNNSGSFNSGDALIIDLSDEEGDDELLAIAGIDAVNFTAYLGGYITSSSGEKEAVMISVDSNGDIDGNIGDEGIAIYNIDGNSGTGNGGAQITGIKYAPMSNQLILSGTTGIEASDTTQNEQLFTARVSVSNGEFDTSYGVSGINIISNVISNQSANAMTIDENDSVWLSGKFNDSTNEPFITSVTNDASLFTNFSTDGYTSINNLAISSDDQSMSLLQLQNGTQAGKYLSASVAQFNTTNKLVLTRYTSAGVLDTSFSIDGIKALNINVAFKTVTLKELADGSIIIAGTQINGLTEEGFIAKVDQDGYLDDSFATEGIYTTVDILNSDINFTDVAIDSGGSIVAVGTSTDALSVTRSFATMLKSDGKLENSFGTSGTYYGNVDEFFESLYIDINKDIFIAGKQVSGSDSQLIMLKIDDDANEIFTYTDTRITADITDSVSKVLADSAANLYLIANEGTTPNQAVIIKLAPDGSVDTSFATSGVGQYQLSPSSDTKVIDASLDTTGNIVLSGMSESKGMIARILPDGTIGTLFGTSALGYYLAEQCDSTHTFTSMLLQTDTQVVLSSTCFDNASNNVSVSKFNFYPDGIKP
ncbi:tandem-95 repeat protein [Pseudoalteromonas espejiana]